jgi:hypothetical protein
VQLPCFNKFKELFYQLGKKTIRDNILTSRELALRMMNGGSKYERDLHLSIDGFSGEDDVYITR